MSRDIWNPRQYRAYSSERARPFFELLARVDIEAPAYVVDLGCGPGERTADLAAHWPDAVVEGIDSSEHMISEARQMLPRVSAPDTHTPAHPSAEGPLAAEQSGGAQSGVAQGGDAQSGGTSGGGGQGGGGWSGGVQGGGVQGEGVPGGGGQGGVQDEGVRSGGGQVGVGARDGVPSGGVRAVGQVGVAQAGGGRLRFSVGDLVEWTPDRPVDVIFSNAALQWVPEHRRLLARWVEVLAPGGCLAFGMPGNFDGPSHVLLRELCESPRWGDRLGAVNRHNVVDDPADYFELLSDLGCDVDAWETTYLQVLHGPDPVLEWMKGTALRPALDVLTDEGERAEFLGELTVLLRQAYPPGRHGTLFPFRRVFVVARPKASSPSRSYRSP